MTASQELNRAVAEADGWKNIEQYSNGQILGSKKGRHLIPDYSGSLDACAEFECGLVTTAASMEYEKILTEIVEREATTPPGRRYPTAVSVCVWHATAEQRCRAFLKLKSSAHEKD